MNAMRIAMDERESRLDRVEDFLDKMRALYDMLLSCWGI